MGGSLDIGGYRDFCPLLWYIASFCRDIFIRYVFSANGGGGLDKRGRDVYNGSIDKLYYYTLICRY